MGKKGESRVSGDEEDGAQGTPDAIRRIHLYGVSFRGIIIISPNETLFRARRTGGKPFGRIPGERGLRPNLSQEGCTAWLGIV